jgi:hypothetical protein
MVKTKFTDFLVILNLEKIKMPEKIIHEREQLYSQTLKMNQLIFRENCQLKKEDF